MSLKSNIRPVEEVCFSGVYLSVCVCLCQVFFLGVVFVGVLGWRVRLLERGVGGITTDPVEFPCHAEAFFVEACLRRAFHALLLGRLV